ncbi:MAG: type III pantothenate kinase [Caldilineae bacterium]|nr:MAG: type III pantothenate kinase [Caldilineae bacterium]
MLLTIDIGNSNIVIGVYPVGETAAPGDSSQPLASWRLLTDRQRTGDEYRLLLRQLWAEAQLAATDFHAAALCSVVAPLTDVWTHMLQALLGKPPLVIHHRLKLGVTLGVERPDVVGRDRLADVAAGFQRAQGPVIVVDFGTATTFNVVDGQGVFRGGAIAPGLGTVTDALVERASALPAVELTPPPQAICTSTVPAIQSGLVYGYVCLVEGLLARLEAELDEPAQVFATGGLGHVIAPLTTAIDAYDPWLTLDGVRRIYTLNRGGARLKIED